MPVDLARLFVLSAYKHIAKSAYSILLICLKIVFTEKKKFCLEIIYKIVLREI